MLLGDGLENHGVAHDAHHVVHLVPATLGALRRRCVADQRVGAEEEGVGREGEGVGKSGGFGPKWRFSESLDYEIL